VSPDNILVEGDVLSNPLRARTYLADFCIAGMSDCTAARSASDIYSLAVVAYELLTGRRPFLADTPIEVARQMAYDEAPPPRRWNPDLPPVYDAIFARSLSRNPDERHGSAGVFVQALADGLTTIAH
jgi:serine/threonine protein kinase